MGMMLDARPSTQDATQVETPRQPPSAPSPVTQPSLARLRGFMLEPMPVAHQPIRRLRHHWVRAAKRIFKGMLVLLLIPLIWLAAGYAGLLHVLPTTPPAVRVSSDGQPRTAVAGPYCWFLPGQALCSDTPTTPTQSLPLLVVARNQPLTFTIGAPAPTTCIVSAAPKAAPADAPAQTIGPLTDTGASTPQGERFRLLMGLAPGVYRLDLACQWNAPPLLRWLQGQGTATYAITVRVFATGRPAGQFLP